MHIVFAGGGTAGHINPAIAVADYLKKYNSQIKISFIGTKRGMENRLVTLAGYDFYTIDVAGFQRKITVKNIFRNLSAACKVITSSVASKKLLKRLKPDVVFGTGGYVCGPVLREAVRLGIKTAVHESNAFPGVTIKMLAPLVDAVMIAISDAAERLNCKNSPIVTGNPIRSSLTAKTKEAARTELGIGVDRKVVLAFGGSLGARIINNSMIKVIEENLKTNEFFIFLGTGKSSYDEVLASLMKIGYKENCENIRLLSYIDNMDTLLAAADIVVCRAGAMTVNEMQVCGKPSILIPSPYVAENHQFHNAMSLKKIGAAELIEEKDMSGELLIKTLRNLFSDKKSLDAMSDKAKKSAIIDADRRIAEIILNL